MSVNPFEEMMRQAQEMMASANPKMAEMMPKGLEDFMPVMPKEMLETFFGKGMNPGGLDSKTRLLLTLAGLVASGADQELAIKMAVKHAIEAGATGQEIIETISQMVVFGGPNAMTTAMTIAKSVMDETKEDDA
ncbi:carboxymuconolactone decarboxylase family protein [Algirhabdus cladophorae]|uniref:carboxymuconolactone decarboxylase family protein n=1 Tax=Algirhabdus cladophorae TaxID=3377108 RepID=UPI003B845A83